MLASEVEVTLEGINNVSEMMAFRGKLLLNALDSLFAESNEYNARSILDYINNLPTRKNHDDSMELLNFSSSCLAITTRIPLIIAMHHLAMGDTRPLGAAIYHSYRNHFNASRALLLAKQLGVEHLFSDWHIYNELDAMSSVPTENETFLNNRLQLYLDDLKHPLGSVWFAAHVHVKRCINVTSQSREAREKEFLYIAGGLFAEGYWLSVFLEYDLWGITNCEERELCGNFARRLSNHSLSTNSCAAEWGLDDFTGNGNQDLGSLDNRFVQYCDETQGQ
eukprot:GHVR01154548.1.p1 GENE.GHVR01154548.1~~GHVR01154548.1.p1  ORF type:complete len:279 (+),score=18.03 GHVR01154548.1:35-871(+)